MSTTLPPTLPRSSAVMRNEEWVAEAVGLAWRHTCLAERRKAPPVRAEALAAAWRRLSMRARSQEFVVDDFTAPVVGA